jgi:hypothetical protein
MTDGSGRARIDGMNSRRDKDKSKKNAQDKSSRAERLDRRTSNDGLGRVQLFSII